MKFCEISVFVLVCLGFGSGQKLPLDLETIANEFTNNLASQLAANLNEAFITLADFPWVEVKDISFPVLPKLPDPFKLNDTEFSLPPNEDALFYGDLTATEAVVTGLSTISDNLRVSPTPENEFLLNYRLNVPKVKITGKHKADVTIPQFTLKIESNGDLALTLEGVKIDVTLQAKILLTNRVTISSLKLNIEFESFEGNSTQTIVNGKLLHWPTFNQQVIDNFPTLWKRFKGNLEVIAKFGLSQLLKNCKVTDLAKKKFDCLRSGNNDEDDEIYEEL